MNRRHHHKRRGVSRRKTNNRTKQNNQQHKQQYENTQHGIEENGIPPPTARGPEHELAEAMRAAKMRLVWCSGGAASTATTICQRNLLHITLLAHCRTYDLLYVYSCSPSSSPSSPHSSSLPFSSRTFSSLLLSSLGFSPTRTFTSAQHTHICHYRRYGKCISMYIAT